MVCVAMGRRAVGYSGEGRWRASVQKEGGATAGNVSGSTIVLMGGHLGIVFTPFTSVGRKRWRFAGVREHAVPASREPRRRGCLMGPKDDILWHQHFLLFVVRFFGELSGDVFCVV